MNGLATTVLVLASITLLIWIARNIRIAVELKRGFVLTGDSPALDETFPTLTALVACKDEEENIANCLNSLLEQDYPGLQIIVINDRSEDRTGEIIDQMARDHDNLTSLHVESLPAGWCGKNHAMHVGVQHASTEILFFTDADCSMTHPKTLSIAVRYMLDHEAGMLSILPNLKMRGFWENVIQPACSGAMMVWFDPARVNSSRWRTAYANGAFIVIQRGVYGAVGGHEALSNEIQEDMVLAQRVKKAGLALRVTRSTGLYDVRMYTTLGQILRGWVRIFFGSLRPVYKLLILMFTVTAAGFLPYLMAVASWVAWTEGVAPAETWLWGATIASLASIVQLFAIHRYYAVCYARRSLFWTFPLGTLVMFAMCCVALGKRLPGAKVTWKGTAYKS